MPNPCPNLVEIDTHLSDMYAAIRVDSPECSREAQKRIFLRYEGAIRRYLRFALPDAHSIEEVISDFADRLVDRRFAGFRPEKGRFRDYLKTILFHMVHDHLARSSRRPTSILDPNKVPDPVLEARSNDSRYLGIWRESLMHRAWFELTEWERVTNRPYATIYWASMEPEARAMLSGGQTPVLLSAFLGDAADRKRLLSAEIATSLTKTAKERVSEMWVNGLRKLARDAYEDALLREVWESLEAASFHRIEEELIDLSLHSYLKKAVVRRRNGTSWQPVGSSRRPLREAVPVRSGSPARPSLRPRDTSALGPRS